MKMCHNGGGNEGIPVHLIGLGGFTGWTHAQIGTQRLRENVPTKKHVSSPEE